MKSVKFCLAAAILLIAAALISIYGFGGAQGIIFKLRLARVLCALLCGGALAAAGVLLQNLLKNPLADPYILGTSAGSTLGAALAVLLGIGYYSFGFYVLIVGGAFLSAVLVCSLAYGGGQGSAVKVILAGIAVNIFLSALVMLFLFLNKQAYFSVLGFMLGSITDRPFFVIAVSAGLIAAGLILAVLLARQTDILALGEQSAQVLGADVRKLRYAVLLAAALLVGGAVGLAGAIGFVGFIIPHIARLLTGPRVKPLLFSAALAGAAFLTGMEALNRFLFYPQQIPVGILCALAGAPFFIWILLKNKGDYF